GGSAARAERGGAKVRIVRTAVETETKRRDMLSLPDERGTRQAERPPLYHAPTGGGAGRDACDGRRCGRDETPGHYRSAGAALRLLGRRHRARRASIGVELRMPSLHERFALAHVLRAAEHQRGALVEL